MSGGFIEEEKSVFALLNVSSVKIDYNAKACQASNLFRSEYRRFGGFPLVEGATSIFLQHLLISPGVLN